MELRKSALPAQNTLWNCYSSEFPCVLMISCAPPCQPWVVVPIQFQKFHLFPPPIHVTYARNISLSCWSLLSREWNLGSIFFCSASLLLWHFDPSRIGTPSWQFCNQSSLAQMRFVKIFTRPDFQARNFTHKKCVNGDNFYLQWNRRNAPVISVILVRIQLCVKNSV